MFNEIINDNSFKNMMKSHSKEIVEFILQSNTEFKIVVNLSSIHFKPELPKDIQKNFLKLPVIMFELANYTLESAKATKKALEFEAGFGEDDFASTLTIPYDGIVQILVKDKPIFINLSIYSSEDKKWEKSKKIFSSFDGE